MHEPIRCLPSLLPLTPPPPPRPQALPNATVKALIKVTSYLGADVSDATITVTWTVPLASGSLNVTTDARVSLAWAWQEGGGEDS